MNKMVLPKQKAVTIEKVNLHIPSEKYCVYENEKLI